MRRVVGKAEWTGGAANPRFVVTSLKPAQAEARHLLRNDLLRARRDGEPVVVRRMRRYRCTPRSAVRRRLAAGGSGIRTVGPPKMDKAPEIARRAFSRFHSSERLTVRFGASDGSNPASSSSKSVSWCAATSPASRDRAAITGVALKNVPAVRVKASAR